MEISPRLAMANAPVAKNPAAGILAVMQKLPRTAFREALISAIARTDVSVADISRSTGVSKDQLHKLVQRRVDSTNVADAVRIATFFGQSIEEFLEVPQDSELERVRAMVALLTPDQLVMFEAQLSGLLAARRPTK